MNRLPIHEYGIEASPIILGCMGLGGGWDREPIQAKHIREAHAAVEAALEAGITMFDHADIYTLGKAEEVFGHVLREKPLLREKIIIQSKLGIRFPDAEIPITRYDFSRKYILKTLDEILERLGIEYLDILLLHRPDALMDAREIGETLHLLRQAGKVRHFGVSNMSAGQIKLLQQHSDEKLVVNQLEMSLEKIGWLETGIHVNQLEARNNVFPEGTLEYCQLEKIQLQSWGPLAKGIFSGASIDGAGDAIKNTASLVKKLAETKNTTAEAIVLAWLMKHPANIQPVIGTTNPERIRNCAAATTIELSREEWYLLYVSSRGRTLP